MSGTINRGLFGADVFGQHYTRIANAAVRDRRLTYRASGLLAELSSHVQGFSTSVATLAQRAQEGRKAIDAALRELEEYGYLTREPLKDPQTKRFVGSVYTVTDMPVGSPLWNAYQALASEQNPSSEPLPPDRQTGNHVLDSRLPVERDAARGDAEKTTHKKTTFEEDQVVRSASASLSQNTRVPAPADEPLAEAAAGGRRERDSATPQDPPESSPSHPASDTSQGGRLPRQASAPGSHRREDPSSERFIPSAPSNKAEEDALDEGPDALSPGAFAKEAAKAWREERVKMGRYPAVKAMKMIKKNVEESLKSGESRDALLAACRKMASKDGWVDPGLHLAHWSPPKAVRASQPTRADGCKGQDCPNCYGSGWVILDNKAYPCTGSSDT